MVWLTDACVPDGMRLYAIGDVHGCLDALRAVHRDIEADLSARPVEDWRVVHLGDYVDRGSDSRGVIEFLARRAAEEPRMIFLRGNHDEMFAGALGGDRRHTEVWLNNGGVQTLESYGLDLMAFIEGLRTGDPGRGKIPAEHGSFLEGLHDSARFGDYYFVHAGIDPDKPLDGQSPEAQLWIREPFLRCAAEFEAVVVHGHTPVPRVETRLNRIGIDTGAVFGGPLSCLVLEDRQKGLLVGSSVEPLRAKQPQEQAPARAPSHLLGRVLGNKLSLRFGRRS